MTTLRVASRVGRAPTFAEIKATALRAGYTVRCIVEYGDADYYGWVKPGMQSAVRFTIIEEDTGKVLNFEGWNTNVRDLDYWP